jgi:hypothetical protein
VGDALHGFNDQFQVGWGSATATADDVDAKVIRKMTIWVVKVLGSRHSASCLRRLKEDRRL